MEQAVIPGANQIQSPDAASNLRTEPGGDTMTVDDEFTTEVNHGAQFDLRAKDNTAWTRAGPGSTPSDDNHQPEVDETDTTTEALLAGLRARIYARRRADNKPGTGNSMASIASLAQRSRLMGAARPTRA
jgi:hypothetical protein